jgi:hypothetical protein
MDSSDLKIGKMYVLCDYVGEFGINSPSIPITKEQRNVNNEPFVGRIFSVEPFFLLHTNKLSEYYGDLRIKIITHSGIVGWIYVLEIELTHSLREWHE